MISKIEKCNREIQRLKDELRKPITPERRRDIRAAIRHLGDERRSLAHWRS